MKSNKNIVKIPLADLVEDLTIYPRQHIDDEHVSRIAKALRAGETLPPLVADKISKRLTDGFHRRRAIHRVYGATASALVELRDYESDADMLIDAIAMNAIHGKPLDKQDQIRSITMAEAAGVTTLRIASALKMSEVEVKTLSVRVAYAPQDAENVIPKTVRVALKGSMLHLEGQHLTRERAEAQSSMPGSPLLVATQQIYKAVHFDIANRNDKRLMEALRMLRDELIDYCREMIEA
jgi:ParB-like chromosome segregation protein Spo0J